MLALRHYLELSEAEIADALGISRGSVKAHASRGSATLRALLADQLEEGTCDGRPAAGPAAPRRRRGRRAHRPAGRASAQQHPARRAPLGWYAVGGAVLAAAAVVTGVAVRRQPDPSEPDRPPTAARRSHPTADRARPTPGTQRGGRLLRRRDAAGPRLFREFQPAEARAEPRHGAAIELLQATRRPGLPDPVAAGSLETPGSNGDVVDVTLRNASLHDRPAGMSADGGRAGGRAGHLHGAGGRRQERLPVQFRARRQPGRPGVRRTDQRAAGNAPQLDVLALVSISNPAEGRVVEGSFTADGVASSFEGTVPWELQDADGAVVRRYSAQGTMEDHLTPWETGQIDVSDLAPGTYTFVAMTDDPSGGEEGPARRPTRGPSSSSRSHQSHASQQRMDSMTARTRTRLAALLAVLGGGAGRLRHRGRPAGRRPRRRRDVRPDVQRAKRGTRPLVSDNPSDDQRPAQTVAAAGLLRRRRRRSARGCSASSATSRPTTRSTRHWRC